MYFVLDVFCTWIPQTIFLSMAFKKWWGQSCNLAKNWWEHANDILYL